jgi:hypothetical protein
MFFIFWAYLFYFSPLNAKLHMVIELCRHGAREPLYSEYKPHLIPSKGELTPVGMRQHYNLGDFLIFLAFNKSYNKKESF